MANEIEKQTVSGRYKRANRPGQEVSLTVHANVQMTDARGVKVPYFFATRTDEAGAGFTGLFREDGFLTKKTGTVKEPALDLADWYITTNSQNFGYTEKVSAEDKPFLPESSKPLSQFVVKPAKPRASRAAKPQAQPELGTPAA